jgi:hypothetical protein
MENYEDRKLNSDDLYNGLNCSIRYAPKVCNRYLVEFPEEFQFMTFSQPLKKVGFLV